MAVSLKVLLGLLVIVCVAQFIEMAPEEDKDDATNKFLTDLSEQIKNALNDDGFKKLVDDASNALNQGAKSLEAQMKEWKEKLDKIGEKQD